MQGDVWPGTLVTPIASPVMQSHLALITCCLMLSSLSSWVCVYLAHTDCEFTVRHPTLPTLIQVFYSLCQHEARHTKVAAHWVDQEVLCS